MDLLLNKLERLTPGQRKEVEDYVDFLIFRSDNRPDPVRPVAPVPPVLMATPPPGPVPPLQPAMTSPFCDEPAPSPTSIDPVPEPVHEISDEEDWLTRDYMDLGKYDQSPSPATETVKKGKRKLIQREEQEKGGHHLLDWVD
ncbi:MAG: hypothetical protein LUQ71_03075 [Methanoregula sp.]|nr:hypothetical protein [Methanoregula sp.]